LQRSEGRDESGRGFPLQEQRVAGGVAFAAPSPAIQERTRPEETGKQCSLIQRNEAVSNMIDAAAWPRSFTGARS
jgi:hypothetical protein